MAACVLVLATLTGLGQTAPRKSLQPAAVSNPHRASQQTPAAGSSLPAPIQINRIVILLDPAHGGLDTGSRISDATVEKDVTLSLAFKLRSLLSARGFAVVMTRDADSPTEPSAAGSPLTLDDRAGIANHAHAAACLLLHATGSGNGVHLYHSDLAAAPGELPVEPWLTAQAAWVPQSQRLEAQLAAALTRAGIALVTSSASVRPVDSLNCPALVFELAPHGDDPDSINDADYQQRIAQSIADALVFWRNQVQAPIQLSSTVSLPTTTTGQVKRPETQP